MMLLVLWVAARLRADDQAGRAANNKTALEKLQGDWKVVAIVKRGQEVDAIDKLGLQFEFKGDRLTVTADAPAFTPQNRLLRLDANASPKLLDFAESAKAFDGRKDVIEGVYSLAGDTLEWCFKLDGDQPAKADRPAAVESKADSATVLIKLKRVKN